MKAHIKEMLYHRFTILQIMWTLWRRGRQLREKRAAFGGCSLLSQLSPLPPWVHVIWTRFTYVKVKSLWLFSVYRFILEFSLKQYSQCSMMRFLNLIACLDLYLKRKLLATVGSLPQVWGCYFVLSAMIALHYSKIKLKVNLIFIIIIIYSQTEQTCMSLSVL